MSRSRGEHRTRRRVTRSLLGAALLTSLLVLLLRGFALPVRDLPPPTGAYPVTTLVWDLADPARREDYARGPEDPARRTIRVQLWLPAAGPGDGVSTGRLPWMLDGPAQTRAIVQTHGFPPAIWAHTDRMDSWSRPVPGIGGPEGLRAHLQKLTRDGHLPAGGPPVALIIHGWEGYRALHADIAEELASRGFLVAAADHSYGAAATVLSDGRVIRSGADILPDRGEPGFAGQATRLVATFAADARLMLDQLQSLGATGPVSVIGHSTGGGAAVQLALEDERVSRLVGLDAWVEPLGSRRLTRERLDIPTLLLRSAEWEGGINDRYLLPFVAAHGDEAPVRLFQIDGITHEQFSTLYMYAPAAQWVGFLGPADPMAAGRLQIELVSSFVDGPGAQPRWPTPRRLSPELVVSPIVPNSSTAAPVQAVAGKAQ